MPRITAPPNGVKIRMYRQGHGDCFLLTFANQKTKEPVYMLIDCGFKPTSEIEVTVESVLKDIVESSGGNLDYVVVTHEHEDHVNLFPARHPEDKRIFDGIRVEQLWLGWTANPKDRLAIELRRERDKAVKKLQMMRNALRSKIDQRTLRSIDDLLSFEGDESSATMAGKSEAVVPKAVRTAMEYLTTMDGVRIKYWKPHELLDLTEEIGVRVYSLGPPRSEEALDNDEPKGAEKDRVYKSSGGHGLSFGFGAGMDGLMAIADAKNGGAAYSPFSRHFGIQRHKLEDAPSKAFFDHFYPASDDKSVKWRQIEKDWLFALDWFARKINVEINNSSVVLAFELVDSGKVLLFAGDAQYGNWLSWTDRPLKEKDGDTKSVKELLSRTVLYKVGHHGSHNATLKGTVDSDFANLDWLGHALDGDEFVAMIPAHEKWANEVRKWPHPLPSIASALRTKAGKRVFQSDIPFRDLKDALPATQASKRFLERASGNKRYFDYWVPDE